MFVRRKVVSGLLVALLAAPALAAPPEELLETLQQVGNQGRGNRAAREALRELSQQDAGVLPTVLGAFDSANPLAANYIRSGFEAIADRTIRAGKPLPVDALEEFVLDQQRNGRARRLAFEWLSKVDPTAPDRLIPGMISDPSNEFRRDAVTRLIEEAAAALEADKKDEARAKYRDALAGATDDDQVKAIADPLRKLGDKIDLQQHFGFITHWSLVGPFDNKEMKGFNVAYAPESKPGDDSYKGQLGPVKWEEFTTENEYGIMDIAKLTKPHKGAITYAISEYQSAEGRDAQIRIGTPNAWKLWVNGKPVFQREEYHRGMALDQYRVPITLKAGKNVILLKVCQNEQEQDWAQRWQFQLRVCDTSGAAIKK